jgi:hypothetical protein
MGGVTCGPRLVGTTGVRPSSFLDVGEFGAVFLVVVVSWCRLAFAFRCYFCLRGRGNVVKCSCSPSLLPWLKSSVHLRVGESA